MQNDTTCVLGIGSPHGDDQVGWLVVERLRESLPPEVRIAVARQPLEVVQYLSGCRCAILVDACQTGAPSGTVLRICWPDDRIEQCSPCSSHGFDLAVTLKLAEQLDVLPPCVIILGIEIPTLPSKDSLHETVHQAMVEAERLIHEEIHGEAGPTPQEASENPSVPEVKDNESPDKSNLDTSDSYPETERRYSRHA